MAIESVVPYIDFVISYGLKMKDRIQDGGVSIFTENQRTKKTTFLDFVNLYSGPEANLHLKYASVMNQVLISFLYGAGQPILLPIALFGIFNMYICEKIQIAYFYKKPPMFGNYINERALDILQYAPLLMLLFGYWMLGNRQIFYN